MESELTHPLELFYCYTREDRALRDKLDAHLATLRRTGLITAWHDGEIVPGASWEEEIETHLNTADIILLLISPEFIQSDYCYSKEMKRALERHHAKEARVVPILLRPTDWIGTPFSTLQMLPSDARPVTSWPDRDEALEDVAKGIRKVVNDLLSRGIIAPGSSVPTQLPQATLSRRLFQRHISRRMMIGLAGLATVAVAGSSIALLTHLFQKPPVASPTPASTSSGAMFGYDLLRTHFNPDEHTLSPTTVSRLVPYWTATTGNPISYSSPVVAGGIVYVGSEDYTLHAFHATTGSTLWTASTGYWVRSSPAVAGDVVYVGSEDSKLYAFHAATGGILWTAPTGGSVGSSPAVAGGVVYVGSLDHTLYAFHATTGSVLWTAPTGNWVSSSPAVAGGVVYVGSWDSKLYAFHATTGNILWTATTGGPIRSSPTVANGVVYIGSDDHMLYAFDIATGSILWTASTGDHIRSSPAVANGVVYVSSWDHKLYAFHLPV